MFELDLGSIETTTLNTGMDKELLPEGIYAAHIKDCKVETSKAGHPYFSFVFGIDFENGWSQCPFKGRQLWETLMISHPNETVVRIAQKAMADILVACGADNSTKIHDLETEFPLHVMDKPVYIVVQHRYIKDRLEFRPQIVGYFGRGEFEGKHRYDTTVTIPTPDTCVNGNGELCDKAKADRDRTLARAELLAKKAVNTPSASYTPTASPQGQKGLNLGRGMGAHVEFEDVPF